MVTVQEPVMLKPGAAGRFLVSDVLPLLLSSSDTLHKDFGGQILSGPAVTEEKIRKYVRDFRTIRLNAGQRMGHTCAIGMLAKPGDLVIALTSFHALHVCSQTVPGVECIDRRALLEKGARFHRPYPTIWIDGFSIWPRTSMNEIRNRLIKNGDQRMVILG